MKGRLAVEGAEHAVRKRAGPDAVDERLAAFRALVLGGGVGYAATFLGFVHGLQSLGSRERRGGRRMRRWWRFARTERRYL